MRIWILALPILLAACGETPTKTTKTAPHLPKITHFYGNEANVPKGQSLTLCYGTENVDSVTLKPYDDGPLPPSFNRCVSHTPTAETTYTLTATGPGGETSASFSVKIGPPQAKNASKERVLIRTFNVLGSAPFPPGGRVQLCYTTDGATSVSLQPPGTTAKLETGTNQCFVVSPQKSTTYILTATAADGSVDRMQVSVPVQ